MRGIRSRQDPARELHGGAVEAAVLAYQGRTVDAQQLMIGKCPFQPTQGRLIGGIAVAGGPHRAVND